MRMQRDIMKVAVVRVREVHRVCGTGMRMRAVRRRGVMHDSRRRQASGEGSCGDQARLLRVPLVVLGSARDFACRV